MRRAFATTGLLLGAIAACTEPARNVDEHQADALSWLQGAAVPLSATGPAASHADLAAFGEMAGSARLIALGEATHGSREFFTMKDRLFRYLVEEKGVTGFAIEATMPEVFAIDTYVRTGVGNPAVLLSHQYFWTWNTQEVADLIAWLRTWNQAHPANQVGFYGFDMQYPGVAIDSVKSYVARVAPDLTTAIDDDYSCLASYRNDTRGRFPQRYSSASTAVWQACTPKVIAAFNRIDAERVRLAGASTERDFELALRMARVVVQWEAMARSTTTIARDAAMAENAAWLLDREGPNGKLFLWAHNYHISRGAGTMGLALSTTHGSDYLPVGFAFASGGLNAVEGLNNGTFGSLKSFAAPAPSGFAYEATLQQVAAPNYYVDLRAAPALAADWLAGPRQMRSVGSVYFPLNPSAHYGFVPLTQMFDVLIFIETTTPSTLLPFQY